MSEEHIVKSYEEELQYLNDSVIKMGSLTESQLYDSMDAVIKVDKDSIDKIIKNDEQINKFRSKIDTQIMTLLVKRAPMAIDLRSTIAALKISQDLERIGDLAKSNAKKVKPLPLDLPEELLGNLKRLGDLVVKQLTDVINSYINRDYDKAKEVWVKDEQVDDLTYLAMNSVIAFLSKDKKNLDFSTHLIFATKNLERAGDHITNIAESTCYLIKGEYLKGHRPKGKETVV
ncbi:MAG: PhoU family transcriptional regulator [Pelagibacteraceae bacterium BACL5 MAG-120705-bin12]|jgi:phosphate transport system protein|nr:MAG: PhoU family transcriptional regulator [Pelagibacteraceae bacterium BACL5 MAG-121015-bin10]KRO57567.1 MAG: PhoU family transcriptional regulator [Pelagibacteraceae bacterium BACL5 MAG-121128-bin54]KRO60852.1 MAG: PhoU family transcriptional regulator [Pelagibacteraceae bacterium BACL5 MAG-120705-bin12]KRO63957.1 MAG: PhoU family transcriptional regulator [Pelagibacteraceae bacterium BACL5 MAG-120820-bin39]